MFWFHKKETPRLPFSTDMHNHLVPGVDDGSQEVETSVELLRSMSEWGITRVFPTPHVTDDTFENTPDTIDPAWRELVKGKDEAGIDITIMNPSAEYRIDNFFLKQLEAGNVRPLSGKYLLVENSFVREPLDFQEIIFELKSRGFIPILAHPERYMYYHFNFKNYQNLFNNDVLLQCNLLSLAGYYGKEVKRVAHMMAENGLISFLGSDIHGSRHTSAIAQYIGTSDFRRTMDKIMPNLLNDTL